MHLRIERQDDVIAIAVFLRGGQTAYAPPRNRRFHRQFFGSGIAFNSDLDAIQCSVTDMARPIPTSHPMLAR